MTEQIIRTEKNVRGPIGQACKWLFIIFNVFMLGLLLLSCGSMGHTMSQATSDQVNSTAYNAGVGIGATLVIGSIMTFWVLGDIILGMLVFFTRGKKVTVEERRVV